MGGAYLSGIRSKIAKPADVVRLAVLLALSRMTRMTMRHGTITRWSWESVVCWGLLTMLFCCQCPMRSRAAEAGPTTNQFLVLMNQGKNQYDQGQADAAVGAFKRAVALQPTHVDARLNLANAALLANQPDKALASAKEGLNLDPNSAAARFVAGCASIRLTQWEPAIQFLQECRDQDVKVNAVSYQLARAQQEVGHLAEAAELLQGVVQWEPDHQGAHYALSRVLVRLGRSDEAKAEAELHARILAQKPLPNQGPAFFERCVYTEIRVPFILEQPTLTGLKVRFTDITASALGANASHYRAPFGILDIDQRGMNDLLVREDDDGFRLLLNRSGRFQPQGPKVPALAGAKFRRCLVGDLNNDRFEDAIWISEQGVQVLKFATNGAITDATAFAGLKRSAGLDAALVDTDLTGKLDLIMLSPTNREPRLLRNLGPMYYKDISATSGIPAELTGVKQLVVDDWNGDDLMDLIVLREGQPPQVLIKQRGSTFKPLVPSQPWPSGSVMTVADLNNDLRADLIIGASGKLTIVWGGLDQPTVIPMVDWRPDCVRAIDYDNDGWLDLIVGGEGLRAWRNLGAQGFGETTRELQLDQLVKGKIASLQAADLDQDGGRDLIIALEDGGLRLLHNEGANANHLLKLRLVGNRSNASGLGVRVEVRSSAWQTLRTVTELPLEIGVGKIEKPDLIRSRWSDLSIPVSFELKADPKTVWNVIELELPTGSCPYLYAWDGAQYRFVTDILGAAPMGLHVSDNRLVDADPEELVWIGDDRRFAPRAGLYLLQITSELREVLFLDEAKLVAVDHAAGTEAHPTSKMLPGKPFSPHEILALTHRRHLHRAVRSDGADVTEALAEIDGRKIGPVARRKPQLRGLAEPYDVTVDFGLLEIERPLVLALTGWLRFGGGMANVAASHDPDLPFPFPVLSVETDDGNWKPANVVVGVPCGKTKTILVDLTGILPAGSRRLRLSTAYELYWDRIALFEKADQTRVLTTRLSPVEADLHWHGYSEYEDRPSDEPLTPIHGQTSPNANWRIVPEGWCTRYGTVNELIAASDDQFVLLNSGDELTLAFSAPGLPALPDGFVRDFFLYSVGWEKDSDFHVESGSTVGPMPFHGMDDQRYGQAVSPAKNDNAWIERYNTRWVGPETLRRAQ
jgi:tetratricopeptide (TPR) repeat protein